MPAAKYESDICCAKYAYAEVLGCVYEVRIASSFRFIFIVGVRSAYFPAVILSKNGRLSSSTYANEEKHK